MPVLPVEEHPQVILCAPVRGRIAGLSAARPGRRAELAQKEQANQEPGIVMSLKGGSQ